MFIQTIKERTNHLQNLDELITFLRELRKHKVPFQDKDFPSNLKSFTFDKKIFQTHEVFLNIMFKDFNQINETLSESQIIQNLNFSFNHGTNHLFY